MNIASRIDLTPAGVTILEVSVRAAASTVVASSATPVADSVAVCLMLENAVEALARSLRLLAATTSPVPEPLVPVAPLGIPKSRIAFSVVPTFTTVAEAPGERVVTVPTVMVPASPCSPGARRESRITVPSRIRVSALIVPILRISLSFRSRSVFRALGLVPSRLRVFSRATSIASKLSFNV